MEPGRPFVRMVRLLIKHEAAQQVDRAHQQVDGKNEECHVQDVGAKQDVDCNFALMVMVMEAIGPIDSVRNALDQTQDGYYAETSPLIAGIFRVFRAEIHID